MTLWGGVRLTAPTFLTFQPWQEITVPPQISTLRPQDECGASEHVHIKETNASIKEILSPSPQLNANLAWPSLPVGLAA
ncbi:hypothetical protein NQZ68_000671 [Dissostichus eleginoides]|nr:hypothetical protein NQZ68_000671 [Dissostichus eleginoides]